MRVMDFSNSKEQVPRDVRVMCAILKSMGAEDFEPKVVNQLLEFTHRYVTEVFADSMSYCVHANKQSVDVEDVKLAIQSKVDHSFSAPPPREFLMELAEKHNKTPLPLIGDSFGIRLPPERFCLTAPTYQVDTSALLKDSPSVGAEEKPEKTARKPAETIANVELNGPSKRKREDDSEDDSDDYDEV
eukprot:Nk52_evm17s208 gene=Nk52_evmTU17s208